MGGTAFEIMGVLTWGLTNTGERRCKRFGPKPDFTQVGEAATLLGEAVILTAAFLGPASR
jgi:hypothetical protein